MGYPMHFTSSSQKRPMELQDTYYRGSSMSGSVPNVVESGCALGDMSDTRIISRSRAIRCDG